MKRFSLLLCLLVTGCLSAATLYKVVNKDGTVTYTDRPVEGAVEVSFKGLNSAVMPAMATPNRPQSQGVKRQEKALPEFQLVMLSPSEGETIRNNQGNLTVTAQLSPAGSGQFLLYIDDQLKDTQGLPKFSLTNLDRGERVIQVKFRHNSGKILASTPKRTIFLHKASALINAN